MIDKFRMIAESLGYPFFFGTRDEVYAYINSVQTVIACYRQSGGGMQQFFVFKFKGESPQKMYGDFMRELKKQFTVGVQRTFFYDDVLEVRCPVMNKVFIGGGVRPTPPVSNNYLYFEATTNDCEVSFQSRLAEAPNIEYSTDGETWQEWQYKESGLFIFESIMLQVGDRVYLRGNNQNGFNNSNDNGSKFNIYGNVKAGGNIMSIIDKTMVTTVVPDYGFYRIFENCNSLLTPPEMDTITVIGREGCSNMYSDCRSLTFAADMPVLKTIGHFGIISMYVGGRFLMSNDGTTFNFDFPAPPVMMGDQPLDTYYDIAMYMGNTNGFVNP